MQLMIRIYGRTPHGLPAKSRHHRNQWLAYKWEVGTNAMCTDAMCIDVTDLEGCLGVLACRIQKLPNRHWAKALW